ncbi:hypothetical protein GLF_2391 [Gluconobacter frateurii NBRC 101659]|nr:hypothetical protein GLF_2391 [Gluconobacter frateurii NBRC 101659]
MNDRQRRHHHKAPGHTAHLERLISRRGVRVERQRDHELRIEVRDRYTHLRGISSIMRLSRPNIRAIGQNNRRQGRRERRNRWQRFANIQLLFQLAGHFTQKHGNRMDQSLFLRVERGKP